MSPISTTLDNDVTTAPIGTDDVSTAETATIEVEWSAADDAMVDNDIDAAHQPGTATKAAGIGAALTGAARKTGQAITAGLTYVKNSPRKPLIIAAAVVVALVATMAGTLTAMAKTVTITVDGASQEITTLSGTVNGALSSAGITVGAHDSLAPSGSTEISDGSQIALQRGRTFTAVIDGTEHTIWTTATTVDGALEQLGAHAVDYDLSAAASAAVPLAGLTVTAATLHDISLAVQSAAPAATQSAIRAGAPAAASADAAPRELFAASPKVAAPTPYTTAASTVGAFLDQQGIVVAANQKVTPALDTPLTDGVAISIVTLPTVGLTVGAAAPRDILAEDSTVGEVLAANNITLGSYDKVTPAVDAAITDGMTIAVDKITVQTTTKTEVIAQPAEKKVADASLAPGVTKIVTTGHPGEQTVYYHTTTTNGVAGDPVEVSRKTVTAAVATVSHYGVKPATPPSTSSGSGTVTSSGGSTGVNWDAVAQCESGQRWNVNTGNGYYGGLQFNIGTWLGNGGGKYAPRPDLATKAQQIDIANNLYSHRGLKPWPVCGKRG